MPLPFRTPFGKSLPLAAALAAGLCASAAHASLVFGSAEDFQGSGLGNVNTILTISSPGSTTFEAGSVGRSSTNAEVTAGDVKTGASQTQTRTLGDLGVTSASDLRVVFNALEPGSGANGITLSDLVLTIYDPTGAVLFTSGAFTPVSFADTLTGAGNSGFVFHLDAAQAASAQALAFGTGFAANQVGLSAAAGCSAATESPTCMNATGGFETFFVAESPTVAAIPEPGTYALMAAGLGVLGFISRRRRRS